MSDMAREEDDTEKIYDQEGCQRRDRDDPEDLGNMIEAMELVVKVCVIG